MPAAGEQTISLEVHKGETYWELNCDHADEPYWRLLTAGGCWLQTYWKEHGPRLLDLGAIGRLPAAVRPADDWDEDGKSIVLVEGRVS